MSEWRNGEPIDTEPVTVYFLLPAYNEAEGIVNQIETIRRQMDRRRLAYEIVVVDDGSTDETAALVRRSATKLPITLLQHATNLGVGHAFSTGFGHLAGRMQPDDIVITMDADNTQNLKTVDFMIQKINEGYDVVLGSCLAVGGMMVGIPWHRYIFTIVCNTLYRVLFHIKGIHTYTGFYRAHSARAVRTAYEHFGDALIESDGFVVMAEMLIKFRALLLFMTEVPVIMRYDLKSGMSKMRISRTIASHLRVMARNMFRRRVA
jgi:dolichol-phosphate mannosyltransferase